MSPAEIAARLSSAQRKYLCSMPPQGIWLGALARGEQVALLRCMTRKLTETVHVRGEYGWRITALGLAVRAEIERMEKQDGE
jgi:hypothetical protein